MGTTGSQPMTPFKSTDEIYGKDTDNLFKHKILAILFTGKAFNTDDASFGKIGGIQPINTTGHE